MATSILSSSSSSNTIKVIVCDIEGTTTSISFVKDTLFPFILKNVEAYLKNNWATDNVKNVVDALRQQSVDDLLAKLDGVVPVVDKNKELDAQIESIVENVKWQMSKDRKATALKILQGLVWEQGFKNRELKGHIYSDVPKAIDLWISRDIKIYIYSSGSIQAQKLIFSHSDFGDLTSKLTGYFDTEIGAKQDHNSYVKICDKIGCTPNESLFLTDVVKEAAAAREAGLQVYILQRPGNAPINDEERDQFKIVSTFDDITQALMVKRKIEEESIEKEEPPSKIPKIDCASDVDNAKNKNDETESKIDEHKTVESKEENELHKKNKADEIIVKTTNSDNDGRITDENNSRMDVDEVSIAENAKNIVVNHECNNVNVPEMKTDDVIDKTIEHKKTVEIIARKDVDNGKFFSTDDRMDVDDVEKSIGASDTKIHYKDNITIPVSQNEEKTVVVTANKEENGVLKLDVVEVKLIEDEKCDQDATHSKKINNIEVFINSNKMNKENKCKSIEKESERNTVNTTETIKPSKIVVEAVTKITSTKLIVALPEVTTEALNTTTESRKPKIEVQDTTTVATTATTAAPEITISAELKTTATPKIAVLPEQIVTLETPQTTEAPEITVAPETKVSSETPETTSAEEIILPPETAIALEKGSNISTTPLESKTSATGIKIISEEVTNKEVPKKNSEIIDEIMCSSQEESEKKLNSLVVDKNAKNIELVKSLEKKEIKIENQKTLITTIAEDESRLAIIDDKIKNNTKKSETIHENNNMDVVMADINNINNEIKKFPDNDLQTTNQIAMGNLEIDMEKPTVDVKELINANDTTMTDNTKQISDKTSAKLGAVNDDSENVAMETNILPLNTDIIPVPIAVDCSTSVNDIDTPNTTADLKTLQKTEVSEIIETSSPACKEKKSRVEITIEQTDRSQFGLTTQTTTHIVKEISITEQKHCGGKATIQVDDNIVINNSVNVDQKKEENTMNIIKNTNECNGNDIDGTRVKRISSASAPMQSITEVITPVTSTSNGTSTAKIVDENGESVIENLPVDKNGNDSDKENEISNETVATITPLPPSTSNGDGNKDSLCDNGIVVKKCVDLLAKSPVCIAPVVATTTSSVPTVTTKSVEAEL